MENSNALELSSLSARQRAARMRALDDAERRRFAMQAANEYDAAALFHLVEGHLGTNDTPSENTLRTYRYALKRLVEAMQETGVNLLRAKHTDGVTVRDSLKAAGLGAASIRTVLSAGRALYGALEDAGATNVQPFARVRQKDNRRAAAKRHPYKPEAFQAMLQAARNLDETLLLLLGGHGGLRATEMLELTWADVNLGERRLAVHGKGDKEDFVYMSRPLHAALSQARQERFVSPSDTVLPYGYARKARRVLKALCERARVEVPEHEGGGYRPVSYLGLHSLRHHAGTHLYERMGGELRDVSQHLRHAQIETSAVYAEYNDDRLRKAVWQWQS